MSTVCRCAGIQKFCCTHWKTDGLTPTQFEYGVQMLGRSAGIMPDPRRELWSDWQWVYPA